MRLGISSWAYPWSIGVPGFAPENPMDGRRFLQRAAELRVGVVQIADNLPLHVLPSGAIAELKDCSRDLGIDVEVGTAGFARGHLEMYLDIAVQFGSPILRVVIDTQGHEPGEAEILETLRAVMPSFEERKVQLLLENHDRFPAAAFARIIRNTGSSNLGICLDTVNSLAQGETVDHLLEVLGPWVMNVHLKDFCVRRVQSKMGFMVTGAPAGKGCLNVPDLLQRVRTLPNTSNVILELWPPLEGDIVATVAQEHAWVEESVGFLRSYIN